MKRILSVLLITLWASTSFGATYWIEGTNTITHKTKSLRSFTLVTEDIVVVTGNLTVEQGTVTADKVSVTTDISFDGGGQAINEFSTDGTLGGDSDTALPTEQAVKEYVDNSAISYISYYISSTLSAIANIYLMYDSETGSPDSTLVTGDFTTGDDQLLWSFITPSGQPGITHIESGVHEMHSHFEKSSGTKTLNIYYTLSSYDTTGDRTLIATSEISDIIPGAMTHTHLRASTSSSSTLDSTDRLVADVYANISGAGSNVEVTIHMEGDEDCYVQIPSSTTILSNIFVRQDGTSRLSAAWETGPFGITTDYIGVSNDINIGGNVVSGTWQADVIDKDYLDSEVVTDDNAGRTVTFDEVIVNVITEATAATGVTIDGLVVKDSAIPATGYPDFVGDGGAGGTKGAVIAPGAGDAAANKYLKADATWAVPAGAGDVSGPGASVDNRVPRWNGVGGDTLQDSNVVIDDSDNLTADAVYGDVIGVSGDYTLPTADGNANEVIKTDGSGTLGWTAAGTGNVTAASITDNQIVRGHGGALIVQESGVYIDDSHNVSTDGYYIGESLRDNDGDTIISVGIADNDIISVTVGGTDAFRITSDGTIEGDLFRNTGLSNLIPNGSFEYFYSGTTTVPDAWALEVTPSLSRDTGETGIGAYSVNITADAVTPPEGIKYTAPVLKASTIYSFSVRAKVTGGDTAQMLTTGAGTDIGPQETTSTSWVTLKGTFITDSVPTAVVIKLMAKANGDIVWFDGAMLVEGATPFAYTPHLEDHLYEQVIRMLNGGPTCFRSSAADIPNFNYLSAWADQINDVLYFDFPIPSKIAGKTVCIDSMTIYYYTLSNTLNEDYISSISLIANDLDATETVQFTHADDIGNEETGHSSHDILDTMYEMIEYPLYPSVQIAGTDAVTDVKVHAWKIKYHLKVH